VKPTRSAQSVPKAFLFFMSYLLGSAAESTAGPVARAVD
jgi:hypothetical protein